MAFVVCPVCGTEHNKEYAFCPECGCNLSEVDAVTVSVSPDSEGVSKTTLLKNQVQNLGQMAQKGLANVTSTITDKAKTVSNRTSNLMVQDKVTEAMGNLVNLMINVSKDMTKQIPKEMISAIDLEAEVNFVAFTIGVTIDLAELNNVKSSVEVPDPVS